MFRGSFNSLIMYKPEMEIKREIDRVHKIRLFVTKTFDQAHTHTVISHTIN